MSEILELSQREVIAAADVEARWLADYEAAAKAWRESPERAIEAAKQAEDDRKAREAHMVDTSSSDAHPDVVAHWKALVAMGGKK